MPTTHQDKPGGKQRQRNKKTDQRSQKSKQQQNPKSDHHDEDQIAAMTASTDAFANRTDASADAPLISDAAPVDMRSEVTPVELSSIDTAAPADAPLTGEITPVDISSTGAAAPADNCSISIQTIADAYGDYARKSLQESNSLVEKLMGVRSFDKAIEVQSEFARQAYANFVAESQKILGLYSELARQIFRPWEGFVIRVTRIGR